MVSPEQQAEVIALAQASSADSRANPGGRAANNKCRSVRIKLLSLRKFFLENLGRFVFEAPPARVPSLSSRYISFVGRLNQVTQVGFQVLKGTPLLPRQVLQCLKARPEVLEIVFSKCSTEQRIGSAVRRIGELLRAVDYTTLS